MKPKKSKSVHLHQLLKICLLSLCSLWLTGCATAGYNKSDATARSLQRASNEVVEESRALDLTLLTLKELVNKPGADLKPQFKRFSMALDKLAAASTRNQRMEHEVSRKSAAYFQAWDKELAAMNYEVIRARSQARKVEATNDFHSVHLRYVEAQTAMQPMLSYFEDIRKALSADLTQRGLEAIKPIVANAEENAAKVQVALNRLTGELTASGTRLSSFAFQNVAPGAAGSSTK